MIDDLFKFPIITIDSMNEERKMGQREKDAILGNVNDEDEFDIVTGEAEYPYYLFVGVEDKWIPNDRSFKKALQGKFNACMVMFEGIGTFLVPLNKDAFKKKLQEFITLREEAKKGKEEVNTGI